MLILLLTLGVFAGWAAYTRPLWAGYTQAALAYRRQGGPAANLIATELLATEQPRGTAHIGPSYVVYSLARPGETAHAAVAYYWGGPPPPTVPATPVETVTASAPGGTWALTLRGDLAAADRAAIRAAFDRIADHTELPDRRLATDVPLLLNSVGQFWRDYYRAATDPAGIARLALGLPVLPPLYLVALGVGAVPGG